MRAASVFFLIFLAAICITYTAGFSPVDAVSENEATISGTAEDYLLPFPGILPDHPLYFIKNLRDQLLDMLIQDPIRRIEYLTLMSDKRYVMGQFFVDKADYEGSVVIMEEAELYYGRIIEQVHDARSEEKEITPENLNTVIQSGRKHQMVVDEVIEKSPEEYHERLIKIRELIAEHIRKIEELNN